MFKLEWIYVLFFCLVATTAIAADGREKDEFLLTATWECDDGGVYYSRLVGKDFYWFGEDPNGGWSNVFVGRFQGNTISGEWVDVPKGGNRLNGKLKVNVSRDRMTLSVIEADGGFSGEIWKQRVKK